MAFLNGVEFFKIFINPSDDVLSSTYFLLTASKLSTIVSTVDLLAITVLVKKISPPLTEVLLVIFNGKYGGISGNNNGSVS